MIMIIGMLSISVGTFMNGFKQNNIHIHHHVIRIIVEIIITIICWIGRGKNETPMGILPYLS